MNRRAWPAWLVPGQFVEPFLKGQKNDFPRRASRAMLMLRFVKLPGQRKSAKTVEGGNEQNGPPLPILSSNYLRQFGSSLLEFRQKRRCAPPTGSHFLRGNRAGSELFIIGRGRTVPVR
jgi:hypothetical protein